LLKLCCYSEIKTKWKIPHHSVWEKWLYIHDFFVLWKYCNAVK